MWREVWRGRDRERLTSPTAWDSVVVSSSFLLRWLFCRASILGENDWSKADLLKHIREAVSKGQRLSKTKQKSLCFSSVYQSKSCLVP